MPDAAPLTIELRVEKLSSLFDPFDPFPIPSRDLARGAEEFIVGWAREAPPNAALRIVVHAPRPAPGESEHAGVPDAIARHFAYRAEVVRGDLRELFRIGQISLAIGLAVLALCIIGGRLITATLGDAPLTRFLSEGLIILGWVANWRPIEIFLYDWWPLAQRRRLYLRLASAPVEVREN
jgi:hypothetical protein